MIKWNQSEAENYPSPYYARGGGGVIARSMSYLSRFAEGNYHMRRLSSFVHVAGPYCVMYAVGFPAITAVDLLMGDWPCLAVRNSRVEFHLPVALRASMMRPTCRAHASW